MPLSSSALTPCAVQYCELSHVIEEEGSTKSWTDGDGQQSSLSFPGSGGPGGNVHVHVHVWEPHN